MVRGPELTREDAKGSGKLFLEVAEEYKNIFIKLEKSISRERIKDELGVC